MIENPTYVSPLYGIDDKGRYRTWPAFAGPEPEDLPGWAEPVTDEPLPLLVQPGPLHDEEVGPSAPSA